MITVKKITFTGLTKNSQDTKFESVTQLKDHVHGLFENDPTIAIIEKWLYKNGDIVFTLRNNKRKITVQYLVTSKQ